MMVFFSNRAGENFNLAKIFLKVRVRLQKRKRQEFINSISKNYQGVHTQINFLDARKT